MKEPKIYVCSCDYCCSVRYPFAFTVEGERGSMEFDYYSTRERHGGGFHVRYENGKWIRLKEGGE